MARADWEILLPEVSVRYSWRTCVDADANWGLYLADLAKKKKKLVPTILTVTTQKGPLRVEAIQKDPRFGEMNYLVTSTHPGLLVDNVTRQLRRQLMPEPRGFLFDVARLKNRLYEEHKIEYLGNPYWYVEGMIELLGRVVDGVDLGAFKENLTSTV